MHMSKEPILTSRKVDHIQINLEKDVSSNLSTGLDNYQFVHQALPGINLEEINLDRVIFNRKLRAPILISSMTGGAKEAADINRTLAIAANEFGIAMGLGSQRAGIEHPEQAYTFQIRKYAPDILLLANLGAVQLNYQYTIDHCKRAVDMVEADALILHLNPLQEALQPEGDTRFTGLLGKIEMVCRELCVPVIVKEVGWGISEKVARQLSSAGVSAIDVAGSGGTSWSQVEMNRVQEESLAQVAAAFRGWGIPTVDSILQVQRGAPKILIIASGGLRNGVDIAKCIALGAVMGGMARVFLKAAIKSQEDIIKVISEIRHEIQVCMFSIGAIDLNQLQNTTLIEVKRR